MANQGDDVTQLLQMLLEDHHNRDEGKEWRERQIQEQLTAMHEWMERSLSREDDQVK